MLRRRTPFQRLRGASARSTPRSELLFWGAVLTVLACAIHGWYAHEFEARVGLPVIEGDGALHPKQIVERIAAYGNTGRRAYVAFLSLACLLPVAGSLLMLRLYEALVDPSSHARMARRLSLFAVLPAVCALTENTLHALLAMTGAAWLATLAYAATVAKLLSFAAALLTLALVASSWLRRQVDDSDPHETL
jgi:hypothetical protein